MISAVHVEQKEDLLDAYLFITGTGLVDALSSKGHEIKVDNRRVVVTGGSAGGTCSIFMVSDIPSAFWPIEMGLRANDIASCAD